jgi:hypothetical protein
MWAFHRKGQKRDGATPREVRGPAVHPKGEDRRCLPRGDENKRAGPPLSLRAPRYLVGCSAG